MGPPTMLHPSVQHGAFSGVINSTCTGGHHEGWKADDVDRDEIAVAEYMRENFPDWNGTDREYADLLEAAGIYDYNCRRKLANRARTVAKRKGAV